MHERYKDLLLRYSAGLLNEAEQVQIERHLADCEDCRHALEEWRMIATAVRELAAERAVTLPPLTTDFSKERGMMNQPIVNTTPQRSLAAVFGLAVLLALVSAVLIARPPGFNVSVVQPAQGDTGRVCDSGACGPINRAW